MVSGSEGQTREGSRRREEQGRQSPASCPGGESKEQLRNGASAGEAEVGGPDEDVGPGADPGILEGLMSVCRCYLWLICL